VVNLVLGVPILLGSIWFARRGRLTGLLCWPGALAYALYVYLVYTIGLPFNARFLLNLALVPLSGYTLIALAASIDGEAVRRRLTGSVPARTAGGILVILVALFVPIQVIDVVHAIVSQTSIDTLGLAPFIADVMVLSPMWLTGGILLWRRKALGYVAGAGLLLVGSMLFVGLGFVLVFPAIYAAAPIDWAGVVMMLVMGLVCLVPFALFVRGAAAERGPSSA
jgi:hypothetical protein